jgi:hypothetical protein
MTDSEAKSLAEALKEEFGGETEFEAVNSKGRYRFAITSDRFNAMSHLNRQDEIWKVVDRVLSREAILDVSMILAFAPADMTATKG